FKALSKKTLALPQENIFGYLLTYGTGTPHTPWLFLIILHSLLDAFPVEPAMVGKQLIFRGDNSELCVKRNVASSHIIPFKTVTRGPAHQLCDSNGWIDPFQHNDINQLCYEKHDEYPFCPAPNFQKKIFHSQLQYKKGLGNIVVRGKPGLRKMALRKLRSKPS